MDYMLHFVILKTQDIVPWALKYPETYYMDYMLHYASA